MCPTSVTPSCTKNLLNLISLLVEESAGTLKAFSEDEITEAALITHEGEVRS